VDRRGLALICSSVLAFAGCTAAPGQSAPEPSPTFSDLLGSIVGTVVDEELNPITNAQVALGSSVKDALLTQSDGSFRFDGLPPGPETLYVAAIGYQAAASRIQVEAGKVQEVAIRLSDIASAVPFSTLDVRRGLIACGSGAGFNGSGITQVGCGAADPNQEFLFNYTFGKNLAGILFEMTWTPTQALSRDLALIVEKDGCGVQCSENDTFVQLQGCCYLRAFVALEDLEKPQGHRPATDFATDGGRIQTRTFPAFGEGGSPATVFTQQTFVIHVEYYYGQLPDDLGTRSNVAG
jgi:hypothetical protein